MGGGVGIAAACDYCIANENADIKLSELSLGIGAYVIAPAIIRKIGIGAFSTLSIGADKWRTANWANSIGLFAEVQPNAETCETAVINFAKQLSGYSGYALNQWKSELWQGTEHWNSLLLQQASKSAALLLTEDCQEKIRSILNNKNQKK